MTPAVKSVLSGTMETLRGCLRLQYGHWSGNDKRTEQVQRGEDNKTTQLHLYLCLKKKEGGV